MRVVALILAIALTACVQDDPSADLSGTVTHVRDGDTIEVAGVPVRLQGLTCDERDTQLGVLATAAMRDLVRGQRVACDLTGERTYDREVGRCTLPDGRDLGAVLISQGVCGRCDRYDSGGAYGAIQRAAGPWHGAFPGYCRA